MKVHSIYDFAFRGLLAEEALDLAGRPATTDFAKLDATIAERLSLDLLDEAFVASAKQMANCLRGDCSLRKLRAKAYFHRSVGPSRGELVGGLRLSTDSKKS